MCAKKLLEGIEYDNENEDKFKTDSDGKSIARQRMKFLSMSQITKNRLILLQTKRMKLKKN